MRLILASQSAARRHMLSAAGVAFECVSPAIDEEAVKAGLRREGMSPRALAGRLAEAKALGTPAKAEALVIGADQILECDDGSTLDKPGSRAQALAQLRLLSGKRHFLHSAAAIAEGGEIVWRGAETAALTVRALSAGFLETYLDAEYEAVRDSVGAYHVEGRGVALFAGIEGSHFAILGLPLLPLLGYLRARGVAAS